MCMQDLACENKTRFTYQIYNLFFQVLKTLNFLYYARHDGATSIVLTTSKQSVKRKSHNRSEMVWSSLCYIPILRPDVHTAPQTMHIPELQTSFTLTSPFSRMQTLAT